MFWPRAKHNYVVIIYNNNNNKENIIKNQIIEKKVRKTHFT